MLKAATKNGAVLAFFAIASTSLVVATHTLTKDKIVFHEQQTLLKQLEQVIPEQMRDNQLSQSCTLVTSPRYLGTNNPMPVYIARLRGMQSGLAMETIAPDGYNGEIRLLVGFNNYGRITGVRVLEHRETPGLGDKISKKVTNWIDGFKGKRLELRHNGNTVDGSTSATYKGNANVQFASLTLKQWKVRKDGGQFDAFSGATITTRAVVKATKNASLLYHQVAKSIGRKSLNCIAK
ncbi:electron transport complex subunit RsxG [Vibrio europaeus]|uniref:electron transport complex subunit RsxG n=1 Tax=Vibrio europaeus TaxID=300876 RepID=UPI00234183EF|nr:electron transport complex subunit RsxG [Vibrio europaeus]MDC5839428.1 electron transport complex subunit RsxG [Vibrio europaeus]